MSERETVRCGTCHLNQFMRRNRHCLSVERFAHAFGIPAYVLLIPTNKENTQ